MLAKRVESLVATDDQVLRKSSAWPGRPCTGPWGSSQFDPCAAKQLGHEKYNIRICMSESRHVVESSESGGVCINPRLSNVASSSSADFRANEAAASFALSVGSRLTPFGPIEW